MFIATKINDLKDYISDNQIINSIQEYLDEFNFNNDFKPGTSTEFINGITIIFVQGIGNDENKYTLEAHKKFNDLHLTLEGTENIAYKAISECTNVIKEYDDQTDFMFFKEMNLNLMTVNAGYYCFIDTNFAHMPMYGNTGLVKKIVFKIPIG